MDLSSIDWPYAKRTFPAKALRSDAHRTFGTPALRCSAFIRNCTFCVSPVDWGVGPVDPKIRRISTVENSLGKSVIYVMSKALSVKENYAIHFAYRVAADRQLPFAVVYCLGQSDLAGSPDHYDAEFQELREVEASLRELDIAFMLLVGDPLERLSGLAYHTEPSVVVFDSYTSPKTKKQHQTLVSSIKAEAYEVDVTYVEQKILSGIRAHITSKKPPIWPGIVRSIDELQPILPSLLSSKTQC